MLCFFPFHIQARTLLRISISLPSSLPWSTSAPPPLHRFPTYFMRFLCKRKVQSFQRKATAYRKWQHLCIFYVTIFFITFQHNFSFFYIIILSRKKDRVTTAFPPYSTLLTAPINNGKLVFVSIIA